MQALNQWCNMLQRNARSMRSDASTLTTVVQPPSSSNSSSSNEPGDTIMVTGLNICQLAFGDSRIQGKCLLNGHALEDAVLLDNQSTVNVFKRSAYLSNVRQADQSIDLGTNGGILTMDVIADTKHFGEAWCDDRAITNVLSFSQVRTAVGPDNIGYNSLEDYFWVNTEDFLFEFTRSEEGLYYWMPPASIKDRPETCASLSFKMKPGSSTLLDSTSKLSRPASYFMLQAILMLMIFKRW